MHDRIQLHLEERISKFKAELAFSSRSRQESFGQIINVLDVGME